ncbi:MAG: hypothetical protein ABFC96_06950 [Thermoguttaceae bacterium]
MTEPLHILVPYPAARDEIRDGDLLLYRPRDWYTRLIAVAGRSAYVHAGMAAWWNRRLMNVEMTNGGGRAQLLSNLVERWPGVIDVYRANASRRRFSREAAVRAMIGITGKQYGWFNLLRAACCHLPLVRLLVTPDCDDTEDTPRRPPFCSQAVAMACRRGGVDPVPNLPDRLTEPADLSRSPFFAYRFTLTWEGESSDGLPAAS